MGSSKGFRCSLCPDSGATTNIVSEKMVLKHNLKYDKSGDQGINLVDANGENMSVLGVCRFFVLLKNNKKRQVLTALVSGNLEGEPLIGWKTMKLWGLLRRSFPDIEEEE